MAQFIQIFFFFKVGFSPQNKQVLQCQIEDDNEKDFYMKTELLVRGYEVKLTIVWLCGERAYSWTTRYRPGSRPVSPFPRHTPQCTSHRSWGTCSHQNMYGFHPRKIYYYMFFFTVITFLIKKANFSKRFLETMFIGAFCICIHFFCEKFLP